MSNINMSSMLDGLNNYVDSLFEIESNTTLFNLLQKFMEYSQELYFSQKVFEQLLSEAYTE